MKLSVRARPLHLNRRQRAPQLKSLTVVWCRYLPSRLEFDPLVDGRWERVVYHDSRVQRPGASRREKARPLEGRARRGKWVLSAWRKWRTGMAELTSAPAVRMLQILDGLA